MDQSLLNTGRNQGALDSCFILVYGFSAVRARELVRGRT